PIRGIRRTRPAGRGVRARDRPDLWHDGGMTARTDHPGPPRTGGVRERLLDAAYGAVVAGGWSRMRMADIARSAAVSRQTLYNEFGTKEGLLQAVVLREADRFLDGVEHILGE